jgi:hypothetical protein
VVERCLRTNQRQHAAHTGRQICLLDVQSNIGGELAVTALWTEIPGPKKLDLAHCGQYAPRPHFTIMRSLAARARYLALVRAGQFASK